MMEASIADFHTSLYIASIKNPAFHIPYVRILWTHHCGNTYREAFKHRGSFQDVLRCRGYTERVLVSFSHQIQSEYYDRNISVYIEVIALDHFSATTHPRKV